jgi:4-hydroxy-tetrahydrodipicolinate reductase
LGAAHPAGPPGETEAEVVTEGDRAVAGCDVVVDFSAPGAFDGVVEACMRRSRPLVTGTTGVPDKADRLRRLAAEVAVVSSPNMAAGVSVLFAVSGQVAAALGRDSDIEIVETHHRMKKDVPSGTALEIARIMGAATGKPVVVGRGADQDKRGDEIFVHSLRMGDAVGRHSIMLSPKGETIEISHTAHSRECFAAGAIRAAKFAAGASPGLYSMSDVLRLRSE